MTYKPARELGLDLPGITGLHNALTDVPGLMAGYTTLNFVEGPLVTGQGPVRTGGYRNPTAGAQRGSTAGLGWNTQFQRQRGNYRHTLDSGRRVLSWANHDHQHT